MRENNQGVPLIELSGVVHPHLTPEGSGLIQRPYDGTLTQRLATIDPPPDSWTFLPNGQQTIPAIGASVTICSQTIPKGRSAVIWRLANGTALGLGIAGWTNGDGNLVWKMLRNGVPFQYFNQINTIIGLVEQGGSQLVAPLYCRENDHISLVLYNINLPASGQISLGSFSGYTYPKALDPRKMR
jgi:hypothetical protein